MILLITPTSQNTFNSVKHNFWYLDYLDIIDDHPDQDVDDHPDQDIDDHPDQDIDDHPDQDIDDHPDQDVDDHF